MRRSLLFYSLFVIICASFYFTASQEVSATGSAFPSTKHGGGTTDSETPFDNGNGPGVDRSVHPDYTNYYNEINAEAGKYKGGECTQCHEPHASFGETEPLPSSGGDAGPDPYLALKEYGGASANYAILCWYCHENFTNINSSGYGLSYGRWGFYQGKTIFEASSHGAPPAGTFYWPGTGGGDIWPRNDRSGLPTGNRNSCLNCHTPHGIKAAGSGSAYDTTSPDTTGGVPAALQTVASGNPSVNADYLIPRQLIAWEETLCEKCHDATGPSTKNIQTEINKRHTSPSVTARSGHPIDDTALAGRHVVSEGLPVTDTTPPTGVYDPNKKHVECYDCHNPHADKSSNRLEGMKYILIDGTVKDPAMGDRQPYVYEVCIKCHGESHNSFIPNMTATGTPEIGGTLRTTVAQYGCSANINPASACTDGSNKRLEFNTATNPTTGLGANTFTGNRAYHPVAAAGRNTSTALNNQLLGGLSTSNTIQCTDCHNNNKTGDGTAGTYQDSSDPNGGGILATFTPTYPGPITQSNTTRSTDVASQYSGSDPVGPHGSTNVRILRANYNTTLGTTSAAPFSSWDPTNFQLCFNCHDIKAFVDWDGFVSSAQFTNFRQSGMMCTSSKSSLHTLHLTDAANFGAWGYLSNMYTTCANCHYNLHSNAEATNTLYGDGAGGSIPADGDTHLINFSPIIEVLDYAKPRWFYTSGIMRCNLKCHGIKMGTGGYGMSPPVDARYNYYGS